MKKFNELTNRGKLVRLRKMAEKALVKYGLEDSRLIYHCFDTNLLYRVISPQGQSYILRLASPGWRSRANLDSEALWLQALVRDTDIPVPHIIPALNGGNVLSTEHPLVPETWNVTLFSYLPGRLLGSSLTNRNLFKMGELFARLHIHGKEWPRPSSFSSDQFDHYLSRGEEEVLFSQETLSPLPREKTELLYTIRDRVEQEYSRLDKTDLRVIHCDLWHDNIKVHKGELQPFDFEDTILGYRLHDIAMAMLDLWEDTDGKRYPPLLKAFQSGYTTLLDWPQGNMEVLQMGRMLWQLNWITRYWPAGFENNLTEKLELFRTFLNRGRLF